MASSQTPSPRKYWAELTTAQQVALVSLATVQIGLAAAAWTDLVRRPAELVHGPKLAWGAFIAVNLVGPISYFAWGRELPA